MVIDLILLLIIVSPRPKLYILHDQYIWLAYLHNDYYNEEIFYYFVFGYLVSLLPRKWTQKYSHRSIFSRFGHTITAAQWSGVFLVFAGLGAEVQGKYAKHYAKAHEKEKN